MCLAFQVIEDLTKLLDCVRQSGMQGIVIPEVLALESDGSRTKAFVEATTKALKSLTETQDNFAQFYSWKTHTSNYTELIEELSEQVKDSC